jgi:hypothetical protein
MSKPLPETMTIPQAGRHYLGLGKNASYEAEKLGYLPSIPVGKKKRKVVVRIMERLMDAAGDQQPVPATSLPALRFSSSSRLRTAGRSDQTRARASAIPPTAPAKPAHKRNK